MYNHYAFITESSNYGLDFDWDMDRLFCCNCSFNCG